jgi:NAD+ diphosphatase
MPRPIPSPFTGMALDRATVERKNPAEVARLLRDPSTRTVAAGHDGVLISDGSLARTQQKPHEPVLLGLEHSGRALFALDLDELQAAERKAASSGARLVSLREAGVTLEPTEAGLAAYLAALLSWHRRHRFCANCGAATMIQEAGYSRRCPRCETVHFPRIDPVVIMTVEHDGRLLLGRRAVSPPGRYSVLAGFVSPGESAEEAVVREVREESGISARNPTFVSSQPWPFPSSLMLGFNAESDGGEPRAKDGELEEVHWFTRDQVKSATTGENPELELPPPVSIARILIERWVAASIS